MNVFKSKICGEDYIDENMDEGELYCTDRAYMDDEKIKTNIN